MATTMGPRTEQRREAPILRLSLQDIASKLGGHVEGGHVRCPAPGKGKHNRALKVTIGPQYPDGFLVHWFGGGGAADDLLAKEDVLDRLGLEPWSPSSSSKRIKRSAADKAAETKTEASAIKASREKAKFVWRKGDNRDPKRILRTYRRARGLDEDLPPTQRYLPASDKYPEPAMVTVVAAPREENGRLLVPESDKVMGVHIIKLAADGSAKAGTGKDKIILGQRLKGERALPLVLSPVGGADRMGFAEGIEEALTIRKLRSIPAWAAGDAGRLADLDIGTIPASVTIVDLAVDKDKAGEQACAALAQRLIARGIVVVGHRAPDAYEDWNSMLMKAGPEATAEAWEAVAEVYEAAGDEPSENPVPGPTADPPGPDDPPDDWEGDLICNKTGPLACFGNVVHALRRAPPFRHALGWDLFLLKITVRSPLPWDKPGEGFEPRQWSDVDDARMTEWLHRQNIMAKIRDVGPAAMIVAQEHSFDSLLDYLNSCANKWDGESRLDDLPRLFGVEVARYTSAIFRCMMISAVARAYDAGCKVDTVLTLEGAQGKRKSTAYEALFGKERFSDDLAELGTKDAAMQLSGVWVIEIADLAAMKRADLDKMKAFISRKVDRFRPPYGKNVIEVRRRSILTSTTNLSDWLQDETGGRRYLPAEVTGEILVEEIIAVRDQLWAEAVSCYRTQEEWWLIDEEIIAEATEEVELRHVPDPWTGRVLDFVRRLNEVTIEAILTHALHIEIAKQTRGDSGRVGKILKKAKWKRTRPRREDGDRERVYVAPPRPKGSEM
jgi:hypothetical protein